MGKDLHPSIMPFIREKILWHSAVSNIEDVSTDDYFILKVKRENMSDVIVVLSDNYHFGEFDYLSTMGVLKDGGFILIAKPESSFPVHTQDNYEEDKIIVGKIGILLGALRKEEYWTYKKPQTEKKNNKE